MTVADRSSPLDGLRVLEVGGMGPVPFAGMTLSGMGASVIRIERPSSTGAVADDPSMGSLNRGKRSVVLDLKHPQAVDALLSMVEVADVLIEGYRPGVMERLGLGPSACFARNPRLVYGRMTGWGQDGPLAHRAGHDIAYIALTGALHAIGDADGPPQVPVDFVGDFGGGGTYLVMGVLAALLESGATGQGRVVDAAIVDGTAHLMTAVHGLFNAGAWADERGVNTYDGGAPFYAVYRTKDAKYMAVGAVERAFYAELLSRLGLTDIDVADQTDRACWPATRQAIADVFIRRTQAAWIEIFADGDACVFPVLSMRDAPTAPHLKARSTLRLADGVLEAASAPRFEGTPASFGSPAPRPGEHTVDVLAEFGVADPRAVCASGAAVQAVIGPDEPA